MRISDWSSDVCSSDLDTTVARNGRLEEATMSKVEDVLEVIKGMTLIELRDLNKAIEEEFGVTAAAPMAMAAAPAAGGAAAAEEEQDSFTIVMSDFGPNKIGIIKVVRELTSLTPTEAQQLVRAPPHPSTDRA